MDLSFNLDRKGKLSLYIQLYKQLKKGILENRILPHTKLPPIRDLADALKINPATVVKAYDLLEREDLIYKKVGSGSYVALHRGRFYSDQVGQEDRDELEMLGYGQMQLDNDIINFASATPSASLFPVADFKRTLNKVLDRDQGEAFVYQKSQGYYPLRESIQVYLEKQGIKVDIEKIQIVSGAQQAIDLLSKILIDYEDIVLVEEPTYSGALSAFQSRVARIKSIPLVADGIDINLLEKLLSEESIRFIYTMSSFQNPTGSSWTQEKKERLLELAEEHDFLIIEDDCLSELYYKGDRPVSLKALDKNDRVIYIKSFSKIFMPGLRLAFMVLPDRLIPPILAAKYATDISSSGLTQRAFDLYLREGLWDKHLLKMRELFSRRFYVMKDAIKKYLPREIDLLYEPQGGLYFWLSLPRGFDSEKLYLQVLKNGIAFLPGNVFMVNRSSSPFFRLSFAAVDEEEIKEGMKIFARVCEDFLYQGDIKREKKGFTPLL